MAIDYIPRADAQFNAWQNNFVAVVSGNLPAYSLEAGDMAAVAAGQAAWNASYPAHQTAQAAAAAAVEAKDADRAALVAAVRGLVRRIQAAPSVTDAAKAAAGLSVPDTQPTPAGPPQSAPRGRVDTARRLQHTVHFSDSTTPNRRAKPAGVRGCEIWMKVGAPPVDTSELTFVTLDTRTPHTIPFRLADAGKPVTYWLRWVSTRGEPGPWSAAVTATVPG